MFLIGLGALLVFGGILYMARAAIWRGPLSGPDSSRPVRDTLEPPRRGVAGHSPYGNRCNSVGVGGQFLGLLGAPWGRFFTAKQTRQREPAGRGLRPHLSSSGQVYLNIVLTACQNDRPSRR
jgi:hypothetical protein